MTCGVINNCYTNKNFADLVAESVGMSVGTVRQQVSCAEKQGQETIKFERSS